MTNVKTKIRQKRTALSMLREVVFGVGFAILLPIFWGLDGVLYSMPVSDILTFIAAVIFIIRTYEELNPKEVQVMPICKSC